MFVGIEPVAVRDDKGNTIYVRPKMGKAIQAQAAAEFQRLGALGPVVYEFCLLAYNITGWDGPDFVDEKDVPIPVTRANIDRLDPDEPIVRSAIQVIAELNTRRASTAVAKSANGAAPPDPMPAVSPI